jgi:hypothetical protein
MTSLEAKVDNLEISTDEEEKVGESSRKYRRGENPKLRYKKPYWWPYRTFVKQRSVLSRTLFKVSTWSSSRRADVSGG